METIYKSPADKEMPITPRPAKSKLQFSSLLTSLRVYRATRMAGFIDFSHEYLRFPISYDSNIWELLFCPLTTCVIR